MSLGYKWRSDGNFLVRVICDDCGECFDVHALSNTQHRCPACAQVKIWEAEIAPKGRKGEMKAVRVLLILLGVPIGGYLVARWIDFWISRSIGEWMAIGVGVPVALFMVGAYLATAVDDETPLTPPK